MNFRFAFICALALCLASCFDSREEIWINADASGTAMITIRLPENIARLQGGAAKIEGALSDYFENTPAFTSHKIETSAQNQQLRIEIAISFDDAMDLIEATAPTALTALPSGTERFIAKTSVEFEKLNLVFKRRADLSGAIPGASFIPNARLEGHRLTTIIHLPNAAKTHNATVTQNQGRTLIWNTPLADALKHPVDNNFTMPLPIPWLMVSLIAFALILLITALTHHFLRKRRPSF